MKYFDLNIKEILTQWKIADAVREIIANAIDESKITKTALPEIYKKDNNWTIEDFGRGITVSNFSQDENQEKTKARHLIGKFGIGLKDSIAVLFKNKIDFRIETNQFVAQPVFHQKNDFPDQTIHMKISNQATCKSKGTKFTFANLSDADVEVAKANFLTYENAKVLFANEFGQVIEPTRGSKIYVNGMQVSTDAEYTFSYNITKPTKKLLSKMNRERKSLGRDAYSNVVEKIITPSIPIEVVEKFIASEESLGELTKKKIRKIVYSVMNNSNQYVFVTSNQLEDMSQTEKEVFKTLGKKVQIVKNIDKDLLVNLYSQEDAHNDYKASFQYEQVLESALTKQERIHLKEIQEIMLVLDDKKEIVIVKKNNSLSQDPYGFWTSDEPQRIFLVRKVLATRDQLIMTLIHEYAHSRNGFEDASRAFENDLDLVWYQYSKLVMMKT